MRLLFFLSVFLIIGSCSYPEMIRNELVYENDFENRVSTKIDGANFSVFNNSTVLGDFNNDGFTLFLNDIGDHDYVFISLTFISMVLGTATSMVSKKMISQING